MSHKNNQHDLPENTLSFILEIYRLKAQDNRSKSQIDFPKILNKNKEDDCSRVWTGPNLTYDGQTVHYTGR